MNRQKRRRNKRKKEKNTTYNLTPEQIAGMAKDAQKQAERDLKDGLGMMLNEEAKKLTLQAFQETFYIPLLVLRDMGWGKTRLLRFAQEMIKQWEMFEENYFSAEDVREVVKDECKLDLEFKLDHKNHKSTIKVVA